MLTKYIYILSFKISLLFVGLHMLTACNKTEGEGGSSSIEGLIMLQDYNKENELVSEHPAPDEDIYIIYGNDNSIYDNDVSSHFDGRYRFSFLKKGTYQLFAYTECKPDTCPEIVPVFITVEITEANQTINAPTLYIKK